MKGFGVHLLQAKTTGGDILLDTFKTLIKIVLNRGKGCDNGRRSETMGDERKVREVSLNVLVQDNCGFGVAERRTILIQEIHQLFRYHLCS